MMDRALSPATSYTAEYSASQIRKILQQLFPHRRLVLSQFTFFNHAGIMSPTGETFRRGRQCYRLPDILSIACVLALKEEGIPYKNVESVPELLRRHSDNIFRAGRGCRLAGFGQCANLTFPGETEIHPSVDAFLNEPACGSLFWSIDVGELAQQLLDIALRGENELRKAA